jgi:hypothetical protein
MERVLALSLPDDLIVGYSSSSSGTFSMVSGLDDSRRSTSLLATSLAPPSFAEATSRWAIQRRAVRIDTPVSRAMSAARRYSVPSVTSASSEGGGAVWGNRSLRAAQPNRERLAEQSGARCRPARLTLDCRVSWYRSEHGSFPPEHKSPGEYRRNGAIESIFGGARALGRRGLGLARNRPKV